MKKITMLLLTLLVSAALFAQVSGSISSESVYDADVETLKEVIDTSVVIGPVTVGNKFTMADVTADDFAIDYAAKISYALNAAITLGAETGYKTDGAEVDPTGIVPLTLTGSYAIGAGITVSAKYVNADIAAEEAAIGTFTIKASFTF